jgi:hypothetical protein
MRASLETFTSLVAVTAIALSLLAAPPPAGEGTAAELGAVPKTEMLTQGCSWGWHRARWVDHWGYVHWGRCVAIK